MGAEYSKRRDQINQQFKRFSLNGVQQNMIKKMLEIADFDLKPRLDSISQRADKSIAALARISPEVQKNSEKVREIEEFNRNSKFYANFRKQFSEFTSEAKISYERYIQTTKQSLQEFGKTLDKANTKLNQLFHLVSKTQLTLHANQSSVQNLSKLLAKTDSIVNSFQKRIEDIEDFVFRTQLTKTDSGTNNLKSQANNPHAAAEFEAALLALTQRLASLQRDAEDNRNRQKALQQTIDKMAARIASLENPKGNLSARKFGVFQIVGFSISLQCTTYILYSLFNQ